MTVQYVAPTMNINMGSVNIKHLSRVHKCVLISSLVQCLQWIIFPSDQGHCDEGGEGGEDCEGGKDCEGGEEHSVILQSGSEVASKGNKEGEEEAKEKDGSALLPEKGNY